MLAGEAKAVHLLQVLLLLESEDRPQHHRPRGGHGAGPPCQGGPAQRGVQAGQPDGSGARPGH